MTDHAPAPDPLGDLTGHRHVGETVWTAAREAYLAGHSASRIGLRYGIPLSTFRDRARREGWRRCDLPAVPAHWDEDDEALLTTDPIAMADAAWLQGARAIALGDRVAARQWTRMAAELRQVARDTLKQVINEASQACDTAEQALAKQVDDIDAAALAVMQRVQPPPDRPAEALAQSFETMVRAEALMKAVRPNLVALLAPMPEPDSVSDGSSEQSKGRAAAYELGAPARRLGDLDVPHRSDGLFPAAERAAISDPEVGVDEACILDHQPKPKITHEPLAGGVSSREPHRPARASKRRRKGRQPIADHFGGRPCEPG